MMMRATRHRGGALNLQGPPGSSNEETLEEAMQGTHSLATSWQKEALAPLHSLSNLKPHLILGFSGPGLGGLKYWPGGLKHWPAGLKYCTGGLNYWQLLPWGWTSTPCCTNAFVNNNIRFVSRPGALALLIDSKWGQVLVCRRRLPLLMQLFAGGLHAQRQRHVRNSAHVQRIDMRGL